MKLNLGCGPHVPDGWLNVDYALGLRVSRWPIVGQLVERLGIFDVDWPRSIFICDLTDRFPWQDNSVDMVYSSHTLEHFTKAEGRHFISESSRVLRAGGVIRIVVPDLQTLVRDYKSGLLAADDFIDELGVLYVKSSKRWKNKLAPFVQFPHKCMYDTTALMKLLGSCGIEAEPKKAFESNIRDIETVELSDRTLNSVIVEGIKQS